MSVLLHVLCFLTAVPTVVLLTVVFSCNKINRKVVEVDEYITKVLMSDSHFVDQLSQEINQASSTKDTDELTSYIVENFSEKISSEYSTVGKYVDVNYLLEKTDIGKQIAKLTQGGIAVGKVKEIIQVASGEFTKGIRLKVKSVRNKTLISTFILQALPFGITFYRANKYRSQESADFIYKSNDYL